MLGRLALVPSLCCINEPLLFGIPLVMNPVMVIPFITFPVIIGLLAYFLTAIGILPTTSGVMIPLGTPIFLSGLLLGGWRALLFQIVIIILGVFTYMPFFKKLDNEAYALEKTAVNETNASIAKTTEG
jgi:PTS system cellobiose-specific IIC component